jgi:hypothetical protein
MENKTLASILASMLEQMPQVRTGKRFTNANFVIRNKVFAFLKKESLVIKLPEETGQKLIAQHYAEPLVMGKRVMKEWIVIKHSDPQDWQKDLALFEEAMAFVLQPYERGKNNYHERIRCSCKHLLCYVSKQNRGRTGRTGHR